MLDNPANYAELNQRCKDPSKKYSLDITIPDVGAIHVRENGAEIYYLKADQLPELYKYLEQALDWSDLYGVWKNKLANKIIQAPEYSEALGSCEYFLMSLFLDLCVANPSLETDIFPEKNGELRLMAKSDKTGKSINFNFKSSGDYFTVLRTDSEGPVECASLNLVKQDTDVEYCQEAFAWLGDQ